MAEVSAILYSTYQDKKTAKSITNVSPTATPIQIKAFAQAANALTNRTYVETVRVEKLVCDTEPEPSGKLIPTLTLDPITATMSDISDSMGRSEGYEVQYEYNGDGILSVATSHADIVASFDANFMYVAFIGSGSTGTVTLYASEGVQYAATSATFTITA